MTVVNSQSATGVFDFDAFVSVSRQFEAFITHALVRTSWVDAFWSQWTVECFQTTLVYVDAVLVVIESVTGMALAIVTSW